MITKCKKKNALLVLLVFVFVFFAVSIEVQADEEEDGENQVDTLVVEVGYFGGPYYQKAVYSVEDIEKIGTFAANYTYIDKGNHLCIDNALGVSVTDLIEDAGIDINSVSAISFTTVDSYAEKTRFTNKYYLDTKKTKRYCFYSLEDNFEEGDGVTNSSAAISSFDEVEPMIALSDNWKRVRADGAGGRFYDIDEIPDLLKSLSPQSSYSRFRFLCGQTSKEAKNGTPTAQYSVEYISKIRVELGGDSITVSYDTAVLEGKVGSVLTTKPSIKAADSVIKEIKNLKTTYTSSDESIATVDEDGNITIVGEGNATITATTTYEGVDDSGKTYTREVTSSVSVGGTGDSEGDSDNKDPGNSGNDNPSQGSTDGNNSQNGDTGDTPSNNGSEQQDGKTDGADKSSDVDSDLVELIASDQDGTEYYLVQRKVASLSDEGGMQNWREDEMDDSATALTEIIDVNAKKYNIIAGVIAILLCIAGIVYEIIKFKKNVGGQMKNV